MKNIPITIEWSLKLKNQLKILKKYLKNNNEKRYINNYDIKNIKLEKNRILLSKIKEIYKKINKYKVFNLKKNIKLLDRVIFTSTVILKNINEDNILSYKIVGDEESQLKDNYISINSPLASMLISKKKGDFITLKCSLGNIQYNIIDIKYI